MTQSTVVTHTSWFSRIWTSLQGIVIGFALILISIVLIFWNERRAVLVFESLRDGLSQVVTADAQNILPEHEGKLVHISGPASASGLLEDGEFLVSSPSLKLRRIVELYQWSEQSSSRNVDKVGGGTETTTQYTYEKKWSNTLIDSSMFQDPTTYQNPSEKRINDQEWVNETVTLGNFSLPKSIVSQLSNYEVLPITPDQLMKLRTRRTEPLSTDANMFYINTDTPSDPKIGDMRIRHEVVPPQVLSIIGMQSGRSLMPFQSRNNRTILLIESGAKPAPDMFKTAMSNNSTMTNVMRVVGAFLLFIGIKMILRPLHVAGSVIPFIGKIIHAGTTLFSILLTVAITAITISIAWIAARPQLMAASVVVLIGSAFLIWKRKESNDKKS